PRAGSCASSQSSTCTAAIRPVRARSRLLSARRSSQRSARCRTRTPPSSGAASSRRWSRLSAPSSAPEEAVTAYAYCALMGRLSLLSHKGDDQHEATCQQRDGGCGGLPCVRSRYRSGVRGESAWHAAWPGDEAGLVFVFVFVLVLVLQFGTDADSD